MNLDKKLMFMGAANPAVGTAITVTAVSAAIWLGPLATGNTGRNIALAQPLYVFLAVNEAFAAAGAATLNIEIITDDDSALGSPVSLYATGVIGKAALGAGIEVLCLPLPMGGLPGGNYLEYLGLRFTVATGPMTAGKVTSGIVRTVPRTPHYATGYSILS